MQKFIKAQVGSSMVQVMVAGAVLLGTGVYVTKTLKDQESLQKTSSLRSITHQQVKEYADILTDWQICKATLSANGPLTANTTLSSINAIDGHPIYQVGTKYRTGTIAEYKIENYTPTAGLKYSQVDLRVDIDLPEVRAAQSSFGGKRKAYRIPIYLITNDNVVQTCMSDSAMVINNAMRSACGQFGLNFNEVSGSCEGLYGNSGTLYEYIKKFLCDATGTGCTHPYANQQCAGTDVRGIARGNWVYSGFDGSGNKQCTCIPTTCPNPANYCLNTDLETDWCQQECPKGTWDPQDWSPSPSSYCSGVSFTQTASCGKSRQMTGTAYCPPSPPPAASPAPAPAPSPSPSPAPSPSSCPPTCVKGDKSGICQYCSI